VVKTFWYKKSSIIMSAMSMITYGGDEGRGGESKRGVR
jgi:hypothetical protein